MADSILRASILVAGIALAAGCSSSESPDSDSAVFSFELAPGESRTELISVHCGYQWLEIDINSQSWVTTELGADSAGNPTELAWPQGVQGAELRFLLVDQSTLEVTATGTDVTHIYHPDDDPPGCR